MTSFRGFIMFYQKCINIEFVEISSLYKLKQSMTESIVPYIPILSIYTKINLNPQSLKRCFKKSHVFSNRGWTLFKRGRFPFKGAGSAKVPCRRILVLSGWIGTPFFRGIKLDANVW